MNRGIKNQLDQDGFIILPEYLTPEFVGNLIREISGFLSGRTDHALRNILDMTTVMTLANDEAKPILKEVFGKPGFAVRGIYFDKTPASNWKVAWHQDLSIPVKSKKPAAGFSGWSVKEGIVHVQPPVEILEQMVTLRFHLDDCTEVNGPLRVLPGSHKAGKLSREGISRAQEAITPMNCLVPAGGVVVMRPLILHSSSPARLPTHRRVVHLEFAAEGLPMGLEWATAAEPIRSMAADLKSL